MQTLLFYNSNLYHQLRFTMGRKILSLMFFMFLYAGIANCQSILNLNFDENANHGKPLSLWTLKRSPNYSVSFSSDTRKMSGTSLKIDLSENSQNETVFIYTRSLPIQRYHGKILTVSARVKITKLPGSITLYGSVQSDQASDRLAYRSKIAPLDSINQWQRIEIEVPVDSLAKRIAIGFQCQGVGIFNVDQIKISSQQTVYIDYPLAGTQVFEHGIDYLANNATVCLQAANNAFNTRGQVYNSSESDDTLKSSTTDSLLVVLPVDSIRGKKIKFKIPIEGKMNGKSNLYMAFLAQGAGMFTSNERYNFVEIPISGTGSKQIIELDGLIPNVQFVKYVAVGINTSEKDSICVGSISAQVDSIPFDFRSSRKGYISDAQLKWLSQAVLPVTDQTNHDFSVMFSGMNISRSVVGLGGLAHGTKEIYESKAQIIKYLISSQNHRQLLLEADVIACRQLDNYLRTGSGNLNKIIKDMGIWTLHTQEIIDLAEWIKDFNLQNRANQVRIYGTDCQINLFAKSHFKKEFTSFGLPIALVENVFNTSANMEIRNEVRGSILGGLERLGQEIIYKRIVSDTVSLKSKQYLRELHDLFIQYAGYQLTDRKAAYRDAVMAENVFRIVKNDSTGIIWSHNSHVSKAVTPIRSMGNWLNEYFKDRYLPIGFTFGSGNYKALSGNKIINQQAESASDYSYEKVFAGLGFPAFFLNLKSQPINHNNKWLFEMRPFRNAEPGADDHFLPTVITDHFDAIFFNLSVTPTNNFD